MKKHIKNIGAALICMICFYALLSLTENDDPAIEMQCPITNGCTDL